MNYISPTAIISKFFNAFLPRVDSSIVLTLLNDDLVAIPNFKLLSSTSLKSLSPPSLNEIKPSDILTIKISVFYYGYQRYHSHLSLL